MNILIGLAEPAGGETQLLALIGLFAGVLMVTVGGALAVANRDEVGRRLVRARGDGGGGGSIAVRREAEA